MLILPSKIRKNKILKGRTIMFETPTRTKGNMVIIPSEDREAIYDTISSSLFKLLSSIVFSSISDEFKLIKSASSEAVTEPMKINDININDNINI